MLQQLKKPLNNDDKLIKVLGNFNYNFVKKKHNLKPQIQQTKELLKETAEQTQFKEIEAGLLLMAWNLDELENLNQLNLKDEKKEIEKYGLPESIEAERQENFCN